MYSLVPLLSRIFFLSDSLRDDKCPLHGPAYAPELDVTPPELI